MFSTGVHGPQLGPLPQDGLLFQGYQSGLKLLVLVKEAITLAWDPITTASFPELNCVGNLSCTIVQTLVHLIHSNGRPHQPFKFNLSHCQNSLGVSPPFQHTIYCLLHFRSLAGTSSMGNFVGSSPLPCYLTAQARL